MAIPEVKVGDRITSVTEFKVYEQEALGLRLLFHILANRGPLEFINRKDKDEKTLMGRFVDSKGTTVVRIVRG